MIEGFSGGRGDSGAIPPFLSRHAAGGKGIPERAACPFLNRAHPGALSLAAEADGVEGSAGAPADLSTALEHLAGDAGGFGLLLLLQRAADVCRDLPEYSIPHQ